MGRLASLFWLLVGLGVNDGRLWSVITKTGNRPEADTNANVYLHLIDRNARNSPAMLLDHIFRDNFNRGSRDFFSIYTVDFEDVCWIRIYHDNSGDSPGWFLERVAVKTRYMTNYRNFTCNCWVPTEEEERSNNNIIERSPPCNAGPLP